MTTRWPRQHDNNNRGGWTETIVAGDILVPQTGSSPPLPGSGGNHRRKMSHWTISTTILLSHAVGGLKWALFSSKIDLARAARVESRQIWYWRIARARSYKGCILVSFDSPPLRRYGAQFWGPLCELWKKLGARHLLARGNITWQAERGFTRSMMVRTNFYILVHNKFWGWLNQKKGGTLRGLRIYHKQRNKSSVSHWIDNHSLVLMK